MKGLQVLKMSLAFFLAMIIAQALNVHYAPSAGIVGLLTIQSTKRDTLEVYGKRLLSFFVALSCAFIVFELFGYSALTFSLFLILFVSFSFLVHIEDGIAMNAVITTHYLVEKSMSASWIQNELIIFVIGTTIGICINLYMPSQRKKIQQSLSLLDQRIKNLLLTMSGCLLKEEKSGSLFKEFDEVSKLLETMSKQAYDEMNNRLLNDTKYEFQYLMMRKDQLSILHDIYELIVQIDFNGNQAQRMSAFFKQVSEEYHENNDVEHLRHQLNLLKQDYQKNALPLTRDEFENRAILYTILQYLEKFLDIKYKFVHL